jgi:hypothetical protein
MRDWDFSALVFVADGTGDAFAYRGVGVELGGGTDWGRLPTTVDPASARSIQTATKCETYFVCVSSVVHAWSFGILRMMSILREFVDNVALVGELNTPSFLQGGLLLFLDVTHIRQMSGNDLR